jgi:hypothetical protein
VTTKKRLILFLPVQFKDYSKKHGRGVGNTIGGSAYDIARVSQAKKKKKQYSLVTEVRKVF